MRGAWILDQSVTYHYCTYLPKKKRTNVVHSHPPSALQYVNTSNWLTILLTRERSCREVTPRFATKTLIYGTPRFAWKRSDLVPGPSLAHCHHQQLWYTSRMELSTVTGIPPALLESSVDPRKLDHMQFGSCADMHIRWVSSWCCSKSKKKMATGPDSTRWLDMSSVKYCLAFQCHFAEHRSFRRTTPWPIRWCSYLKCCLHFLSSWLKLDFWTSELCSLLVTAHTLEVQPPFFVGWFTSFTIS